MLKNASLVIGYGISFLLNGYPDYDYEEESVTDASKLEEVELEDTCANDTAVVCKNGGICLSTIAGPKCHCPLQGGINDEQTVKDKDLKQNNPNYQVLLLTRDTCIARPLVIQPPTTTQSIHIAN